MIKYYVYNIKDEDRNAFVVNPDLFAETKFDPLTMEFSNIVIEAEDPQEASRIYYSPKENDVFCYAEEPPATTKKRELFNKSKQKILKSKIALLTNELAYMITNFHECAYELSKCLHGISKDPQMDVPEIYKSLVRKYAEAIEGLSYTEEDGLDDDNGTPTR
jgi:hypothetical protein